MVDLMILVLRLQLMICVRPILLHIIVFCVVSATGLGSTLFFLVEQSGAAVLPNGVPTQSRPGISAI